MNGSCFRLTILLLPLLFLVANAAGAAESPLDPPPAWWNADRQGPLSAAETGAFMRRLAEFVFENHLKRDRDSVQRGMVYEYFSVPRKGRHDQFVQGEGLDTMHDGCWLAAANVNAYRATGDGFYLNFLTEWQLPFYLKMLNHSDELFSATRNDAREGAKPWGKPWAYQEGEKGFVPYFWDDGGSVSIERCRSRNPLGPRPCVDHLAGKPNPNFLLDGYSQGMSNHMAQDVAVLVQQAWLLLKDLEGSKHKTLAAQTAEAAMNLHESRMRHHGAIPMCAAAAGLTNHAADLLRRTPDPESNRYRLRDNHYTRLLAEFEPGQTLSTPGFADDQQYDYYHGIARLGGRMPQPLAFKIVYDAYTEPQTFRYYCDDIRVPAGINRFDLHGILGRDGKLLDYRSDRKGPYGGPRPIGSRFGPQNMICCGWALQVLRAMPEVWESRYRTQFADDLRVYVDDRPEGCELRPAGWTTISFDGVELAVRSTRKAFELRGPRPKEPVDVTVFSGADGRKPAAVFAIGHDGSVSAVNAAGDPLALDVRPTQKTDASTFCVAVPYTICKGQASWLNVIEHGRYSIGVGQQTRNLYVASSAPQVIAWLEHELGAGLRTWQAVFDQVGCIPTGIGAGSLYDDLRWDDMSDSGGYAHLISAAAQWLIYLDARRDWQLHHIPTVH